MSFVYIYICIYSAPVITEDTARQALIEFVSKQTCWGTGTAKSLTFEKLQSSTSYHVSLFSTKIKTSNDVKNLNDQKTPGEVFKI